MPTINNLSFTVRFDLSGAPILRLTDASTLPAGAVGRFIITTPDGYTRTGSFNPADITSSGGAFSYTMTPASDGNVQCGNYRIVYEAMTTDLVVTTFTRQFNFQYTPKVLNIVDDFDVFTPDLDIVDSTNYAIGGYTNTITRSWTVVSTPTGTITGTAASIDLRHNNSYFDANYTVTFSATLTYTSQTSAWLSIRDILTKTYTTYAQTPPTVDDLVADISSLKDQLENAINQCRERGVIQGDVEWAQVLYTHIIDKILTNQTDGIFQDLKDLIAVLNNYQIPAYTPTNQPIPPYDLSSYLSSAVWGNITGNITNQTDLVSYINTVVTSRSFATNIGDGTNTTYTINHNLNSKDVVVDLYEISTGETVYADITRPTVNTAVVSFATAPTTNQYRVIIIK